MKSMVLSTDGFPIEMQIDHKRRYEFASKFLNQHDSVLDIGCGSGYGCNILSKDAGLVNGIDINPDSIKEAINKYPHCDFSRRDITKIKRFGQYNIITCFEFLEHITKKQGYKFLGKIAKSCGDIFILSTPVNAKLGINPYHKSQWSEDELKAVFNLVFSRVIFLSQDWASSLIHFPYSEQHSFIVAVCIK